MNQKINDVILACMTIIVACGAEHKASDPWAVEGDTPKCHEVRKRFANRFPTERTHDTHAGGSEAGSRDLKEGVNIQRQTRRAPRFQKPLVEVSE